MPAPDRLHSYALHGAVVRSDLPLPELRKANTIGTTTIRVTRQDDSPAPPARWFHRWKYGAETWLTLGRSDGRYLLRFTGTADFDVSPDGGCIGYRAHPDVPVDTVRHLLVDQVIPLALQRSGRLVLHASAVHVPRFGAICFAGPTSAGKSALAAALGTIGCTVISDDAVVLHAGPSGAAPRVSIGYPGLRLWADIPAALGAAADVRGRVAHYTSKKRVVGGAVAFRRRLSPLRVVFVLGKRSGGPQAVRARPLRGSAKLVALTRYAFLLDTEDGPHLARMFAGLAQLASRVPVVRIHVRDDPRALRGVARAVRDEAARAVGAIA